jgi:hypothetical protein
LDEESGRGVDNVGGVGVGWVVGRWVGKDQVEPAGRRPTEAVDLMEDEGHLSSEENEGAVEGELVAAEGAAGMRGQRHVGGARIR